MSERVYTGKVVGSRDGFEAVASNTFRQLRIEIGHRGDTYILEQDEAVSFAKWILGLPPYNGAFK